MRTSLVASGTFRKGVGASSSYRVEEAAGKPNQKDGLFLHFLGREVASQDAVFMGGEKLKGARRLGARQYFYSQIGKNLV